MLQPAQRLSKVIATRFKQEEFEHVMNFIQLKGIRNIRELLLLTTSYHQMQRHKLSQEAK